MGSMLDNLFTVFGWPIVNWSMARPILYRKRGGGDVQTIGVWERKQIVAPSPGDYGRIASKGGVLTIQRVNIIDSGREPKEGDEVLIDGEMFRVIEIEAEGEEGFRITCEFVTKIETSGGGLRVEEPI